MIAGQVIREKKVNMQYSLEENNNNNNMQYCLEKKKSFRNSMKKKLS